jgi:hypothetical protein
MKMKKSNLVAALVMVSGLVSTASFAATPQLLGDVNLGLAHYSQGYGSKFAWGVGARARFDEQYEVGVEYRRVKLASDSGVDLTAISYLVNAMYRMPAGPGHLAFGIEAGETDFDVSLDLGMLSATVGSVSKFAVGPKISYEIPVGESIEVGASIDDLLAFNDPKLNSVNVIANLSYKF